MGIRGGLVSPGVAGGWERLDARQRDLVASWLPGLRVVGDLGWGEGYSVVLEARVSGDRVIVKAGGPNDHHCAREIRAHRAWTGPWVATGHAARLLFADTVARVLVTEYVPGRLVEGSPAQDDPDVYRQAGALLSAFHGQGAESDPNWVRSSRTRVARFLDRPHRIAPGIQRRIREEINSWPDATVLVVPTHGDWQPRNWLVDDGEVRVIDFGRADLRPAHEDFVRLARQDFLRRDELEAAFVDGYGSDPREPDAWRRSVIAEAVGTAVWAYGMGDTAFEQLGHDQLAGLFPA